MNDARYSSNPEIRKVQEHAEQLGIYEILRNIICEGKKNIKLEVGQSRLTEWEGCQLHWKLEKLDFIQDPKSSSLNYMSKMLVSSSGTLSHIPVPTIIMTMPDGTTLFRGQKHDGEYYISDFRFGKWVERITAYSEEVTTEYEKTKQEKAEKKRAEELKPFSEIDF